MNGGAVISCTIAGVIMTLAGGWLNLTTPAGTGAHNLSAFLLLVGITLAVAPLSYKIMK